jgi:hypothetical protein
MDQPHTLVQYRYGHSKLLVLAGAITGIAIIHWFSTSMGMFHYRYWHPNMVPVLSIFALWFSTGIGTVHYQYWHSVVPIPVMANMYLESVPVWAHSITRTGIQLCLYQFWHFCTLDQYQYWHGPLPVLALNGASTSIGIFALLSNTSIGMVHYWYCHYLVPVPVLAFWYFCLIPVLARSITGTGIKWCQYQYWHICTFFQ